MEDDVAACAGAIVDAAAAVDADAVDDDGFCAAAWQRRIDARAAVIGEQLAANEALAKRKGRDAVPWLFPAPAGRSAVMAHIISTAVRRCGGCKSNHLGTTKASTTSAVDAR